MQVTETIGTLESDNERLKEALKYAQCMADTAIDQMSKMAAALSLMLADTGIIATITKRMEETERALAGEKGGTECTR